LKTTSLKELFSILKENIKLSVNLFQRLQDFYVKGLYPPRISSVSFTLINVTVLGTPSHNE